MPAESADAGGSLGAEGLCWPARARVCRVCECVRVCRVCECECVGVGVGVGVGVCFSPSIALNIFLSLYCEAQNWMQARCSMCMTYDKNVLVEKRTMYRPIYEVSARPV